MWVLDHNEGWVLKNWCFWTVVLEKTLESPLDCKEIQPVNSKGNQSLIFIGSTDAEAEALILWPPDAKNWLIGKDPDAKKDWGQEKKGTAEDETAGGITNLMDISLSKLQEIVKDREAWSVALHGVTKSWPWLSGWTTMTQDATLLLASPSALPVSTRCVFQTSSVSFTAFPGFLLVLRHQVFFHLTPQECAPTKPIDRQFCT